MTAKRRLGASRKTMVTRKPRNRRKPRNSVSEQTQIEKAKPRGKPFEKGNAANPNPFPPGVSGNPGGRPKVLGEAYREWLAKFDEETGVTRAQGVAMAMGKAALGGKVDAAREIRSATEGELFKVVSNLDDDELDGLINSLAERAGISGSRAADQDGATSKNAVAEQPPAAVDAAPESATA